MMTMEGFGYLMDIPKEPLKVLDENNTWYSFDAGANSRNKSSSKMVVDYNNNIWFVMRGQGFFGYDFGSDLSDKATTGINNLLHPLITETFHQMK